MMEIPKNFPIRKLPPGIALGAFDGRQIQSRAIVALAQPRVTKSNPPKIRIHIRNSPKGKSPSVSNRPIKFGSDRHKVILLMDGSMTPKEIDSKLKLGSSCLAHASCAHRDCGIGYSFDELGRIQVLLPLGITSLGDITQ